MNSVNLIGHLCFEPEHRDVGDTIVTRLRIAVGRGAREGADFIDVSCFGRLAIVCSERLSKGSRVGVTGRLHHHEWTDAEGVRRQALGVVANSVDFLSPRRSSDWHDHVPEPADEQPVAGGAGDPGDIPF